MPPPPRLASRGWFSYLVLSALVFAPVALSTRASAQPPEASQRARFELRTTRARSSESAPVLPAGLRALLERFGGKKALRAVQRSSFQAGQHVALHPMFWVTRDHSGAMVALGGRFR